MSHYKTPLKYSFLVALLLVVTTQVVAVTPRPINYQGYLAQPDGTPIDTTVAITVELWTAATAGTLLYSETHAAVTVSSGRFSIEISTGDPMSGTFNADQFQQDTWLALTINGELLNPRSQLGAVAGSQHAEIAERLSTSCADGERLGFRNGVLSCYGCFPGDSSSGCFDGDPEKKNVGMCRVGRQSCIEGAYSGTCLAQVLPTAESCNQKDDDCNGLVDDGPWPAEVCNSIDDDCNGLVDDGTSLPGCINLYIDNDGDGFGDETLPSCNCAQTSATAAVGGDCDDTDYDAKPGQNLYFTAPTSQGSFDFNCDDVIEKQITPIASCTYNGTSCDYVSGFMDSIPACGEAGTTSSGCSQEGAVCTVIPNGVVMGRMGCR